MLLAGQRGAAWMYRAHGDKGRFVPGYLPALQQPMEGDSDLRQAGAAFALARAARFLHEESYAARATQALLALLDDTALDAKDPDVRYPAQPAALVNRLGLAGALVLAVHELPAPQKDLLDRAEQLCHYIRKQAKADGSLACVEGAAASEEEVNLYAGLALRGLMASQRHRPAGWKVDLVTKSTAYYRAWWKKAPSLSFAPDQLAAHAGAYLARRDKASADFAFELADWLCGLQYVQIQASRVAWYGGMMSYQGGRAVERAPTADSAACVEALVEACKVARDTGDVTRFQRYTEAAERGLQFLATLQYTDAATRHFSNWYRPKIVGAFHASPRDGDVRIDHCQHAVAALFGYLEQGAK
jgi:hypothetical protein